MQETLMLVKVLDCILLFWAEQIMILYLEKQGEG